ncbi:MAG: sigma-70 family RNA polymerase sigma factor [Myxococcales bacterium]|nr:sigma-70 family RNA polymerase sigma factor [Myxococcales bacterium]
MPSSLRSAEVELDDETLVQRCREGDEESFRCLVQRYQKKLFSAAYGMVHNPEDALDLVQEAFLKAHRYLANFQGNSSFYTWMYRIVINLCIDFIRREGKHQTLDYNDTLQHNRDNIPDEQQGIGGLPPEDPVRALNNKELGEQIWTAIRCLSDNHRAVIVLRELEGMSYEDIAQTLKCSKGTVMSRLHHARAHMRRLLEGYIQAGRGIPAHRKQASATPSGVSTQNLSHAIEASGKK